MAFSRITVVVVGILLALPFECPADPGRPTPEVAVADLGHVGLAVSNLEKSTKFYANVFNFQLVNTIEVKDANTHPMLVDIEEQQLFERGALVDRQL